MDTPSLLTKSQNLTNVQSTTVSSASITPAANKVVFVNVFISVFSGTPPTVTVSGCNLTWTAQVSHVLNYPQARQVVYTGIGASPSTGTIDMVVGASGTTECMVWEIVEVGGLDTAAPITQVVAYVGSPVSPTVHNVSLAALTGSASVVAAWARSNGDSTASILSASSGYTLFDEALSGNNSNPGALAFTYANTGTTTPGVSSAVDFLRVNGVGFELKNSTSGSYNIVAAQGSYTLSGQDTALRFQRNAFPADQGSYSLTGQTVTLQYGNSARTLVADYGLYTVIGSNALVDVSIAAAQGSYTLSGQAVTLTFQGLTNPVLVADQGSYSLNGQSVNLLDGFKTFGDQGSYVLTGRQVGLFWSGAPVGSNASCRGMSITSLRIGL